MAKKKKPDVKIVEQVHAEKKPKHPGGRPTIYTEELAKKILDKIKCGEPLLKICDEEEMPGRTTVYEWMESNKKFANKLTRARKLYAISLVDNLAQSASKLQEKLNDTADNKESNDRLRALSDVIKTSSNIFMWIAGKYNRKIFGDHSTQKVTQKNQHEIVDQTQSRSKLFDKLSAKDKNSDDNK